MAKKRKTRAQKLVAQTRRDSSPIIAQSVKTPTPKSQPTHYHYAFTGSSSPTTRPSTTIKATDYMYLKRELLKTALLTGAIVVGEIVLVNVLQIR